MMTMSMSCSNSIPDAVLPTMASLEKHHHQHQYHVNYNLKCSVVLIPSRQEYAAAGIDLWYSQKDQMNAQHEALEEIAAVLRSNPSLNVKSAMRFLYQPRVNNDNDGDDDKHSDECSTIRKDPINMVVVNQSVLQYKLHSRAIMEALGDHWHIESVMHYHTIEELISHRRLDREKHCEAQTEAEAPTIILLDQNVFCTYDLWSISMLIPSSIVTELRQYYHADKVLIGLCLEGETNNSSLFVQSIEQLVDFQWVKPFDSSISMLPVLAMTHFKKDYNLQLNAVAYNDSIKLRSSSESVHCDLSSTGTTGIGRDTTTTTCIKDNPITSTAMRTYFKFLS